MSPEQWQAAATEARNPLGDLRSRTLKSARYTTTLPAVPDTEAVVLQFNAVYENHPNAVETVTPILDNGVWRVSGYYVK